MRKSELSRSFQLFLRIMRDGKERDVVLFSSLCFFFGQVLGLRFRPVLLGRCVSLGM
jgi:hypothetical protein